MPNQPRPDNPNRNVRITDDLWARVKARANSEDKTASDVVRRALEKYLGARLLVAVALTVAVVVGVAGPAAASQPNQMVKVRAELREAARQHPSLHADTRRGYCLRQAARHPRISLRCRHTVRVAVAERQARLAIATRRPAQTEAAEPVAPATTLPAQVPVQLPPAPSSIPATLPLPVAPSLPTSPMTIVSPVTPNGRLVIYVHGSSELGNAFTQGIKLPMTETLLAAGYTVAGHDAGGNNWGNAASVDAQVDLYNAVPGAQKAAGVYLWGQSMGGLASLEAIDRLPNVKAWAGIYPVCNLQAEYDHPDLAGFIAQAYPTGLGSALATLSPVAPVRLGGLPMIFWHSPADTVVPKVSNTDLCAAQYAAAGAVTTVVSTVGDHGDPSNFDGPALLAFFNAA